MPDMLVRNVPEPVLDALKRRAARHHRSMQQEVLTILEAATRTPRRSACEVAETIRARLSAGDRTFSDSTELIREDRER